MRMTYAGVVGNTPGGLRGRFQQHHDIQDMQREGPGATGEGWSPSATDINEVMGGELEDLVRLEYVMYAD